VPSAAVLFDLQQAINDAASDATLFVRGTCTANFQIGAEQNEHVNLTLTGQRPAGYPVPTISGGGNTPDDIIG